MIKILYENKDIVIAVKPSGLLSQSDTDGGESMVSMLNEKLGEVFPVHRLDSATGGVMVYAKNTGSARTLSGLIQDRLFAKEYLAIVHGTPDVDSGEYNDLLFRDSAKNKSYVVKRMRRGVKEASLEYTALSKSDGYSLVRVKLHTGRTHQIRAQFSYRGMPIIGDKRYGSSEACSLGLWSYRLAFEYGGGTKIDISCPPPPSYPWSLFENEIGLL